MIVELETRFGKKAKIFGKCRDSVYGELLFGLIEEEGYDVIASWHLDRVRLGFCVCHGYRYDLLELGENDPQL